MEFPFVWMFYPVHLEENALECGLVWGRLGTNGLAEVARNPVFCFKL